MTLAQGTGRHNNMTDHRKTQGITEWLAADPERW